MANNNMYLGYLTEDGKKLTNDTILMKFRADLLTIPAEVTAHLILARQAANNVTGKLMLVNPDGTPQHNKDDLDIIAEIGTAEIEAKRYSADYLKFVYDEALKDENPIEHLARIALSDVATVSEGENKNTGNYEVKVNVKTSHVNLDDFIEYAAKAQKSLLPAEYSNYAKDLYSEVVTWRLQQVYLAAQEADDQRGKKAAVDKLATIVGGSDWKCIKELNVIRSKKHMKGLLKSALSLILPDFPASGRDVAFLIDCACLGAGRDVYSLRFCKLDTFRQRMFEVLIAYKHDLALQFAK